MAKSKPIKTSRLLIEPFSEKYLTDKYVNWLNDPTVTRYSEQRHQRHTLESCKRYAESFDGTPHYFWAISVIDSDLEHVGNINAYVDKINKIADVGILIGETNAWGKGYATEAWKAICGYLLRELRLRKVTAGTISSNESMLKLMKKVGMVEDGGRMRQYIWEGKEVDIIHMAMFRDKD